MATPIQFWKQYTNHIPPTAVGDNIFFGLDTTDPTKGSVYVTDNQGKVVKCGENYDKQISILSDKVVWKPAAWKTEQAPPSEYPNGQTTIFPSGANFFKGFANVIVRTVKAGNNMATQYLEGTYGGFVPLYYRQANPDFTWTQWKEIATTDKIDILWEGNTSSGILTLTSILENYNKIIVTTGGGTTTRTDSYDNTPTFVNATYLHFTNSTGVTTFSRAGNDATLTIVSTTQAIRRIVGIRRGGA